MFGRMSAMSLVRLDAGTELEVAVAELLAVGDYPEIARWIQFPRGLMLFLLVLETMGLVHFTFTTGVMASGTGSISRTRTTAVTAWRSWMCSWAGATFSGSLKTQDA